MLTEHSTQPTTNQIPSTLQEVRERANQIRISARPGATSSSYSYRQECYRIWCSIKSNQAGYEFLSDYWINEDRLLLFMEDIVIGKPTFPSGQFVLMIREEESQ